MPRPNTDQSCNVYQKDQFELLAPGGDIDAIKAAIAAGADAVYCGLDRFNARNRAANITLELLEGVVALAHEHKCKVFLTLNIMLLESELPAMVRLLQQLKDTAIDGVIVQDLGLALLLKRYFPALDMHASTQMNTHNIGQMALLAELGMSRVNLSRELSIDEIKPLATFGHEHNMLTEVFIHGSYCVGFSGVCYLSSARNGASGNRGRCSQPCRDQYQRTDAGNEFPLNMKDNSAFGDMQALADAGVYSLKVEGRIKKSHYVYTVVDNWRRQIDAFCGGAEQSSDLDELFTVFNRDFSNGYLMGKVHRGMFIDNPRDHSATHFGKIRQCKTPEEFKLVKRELYDTKTDIIRKVEQLTAAMPVVQGARRSLKGNECLVQLPDVNQAVSKPPARACLMVLIADVQQLAALPKLNGVEYCLQLPEALADFAEPLLATLTAHPELVPVFPAVMIDRHFDAARTLLEAVRPASLITHNLGIAQLARELSLEWIAGSQLNVANSMALECLQSELGAHGAFISKELSGKQLQRLVRPHGFSVCATLYEPNHLLTSRQCLLIQSVGCRKVAMNAGCMKRCSKSATLQNLNDEPYLVHKEKGSHNCLYSQQHTLNLALLENLPGRFTHYMVDLRDIPTQTRCELQTPALVALFARAVAGDTTAIGELAAGIHNTQNRHFLRGV